MYVDSHAHLDGKKFDDDREQVLARAREAGVEAVLSIGNGSGPDDVDCALRLMEQFPAERTGVKLYASVGVHPHEAALATEAHFARMAELARDPRVVGWGEIGLDYFYDHTTTPARANNARAGDPGSPREMQKQVFVRQMKLAAEARKPIIIHCRPSNESENAWDDLFALLHEHWPGAGVLHCFTGELKHMERAVEIGFMVSFAGNVSFPKAQNIRDAAKAVPLERMLIETDCPYLAPVPHRGKRNEPAFVVETARVIGELRGVSGEEIGRVAAENFYRFFT